MPYAVVLEAIGTLETGQFWPCGNSDGDTVKMTAQRFRYRRSGQAGWKSSKVLWKAKVKGKGKPKRIVSDAGVLTIRLQGIDAPELHYPTSTLAVIKKDDQTQAQRRKFLEVNDNYRQCYGKTAAQQLHNLLAGSSKATLRCIFRTKVDEPNDICDVYGRFVGDVIVQLGGKQININQWMLEVGHAFPAFYNSLEADEIEALIGLSKKGRQKAKSVWQCYKNNANDFSVFDFNEVHDKSDREPEATAADCKALLPKFFRRFAAYQVNFASGMFGGTFADYVVQHAKQDQYFDTKEFVDEGPLAALARGLSALFDTAQFHSTQVLAMRPEDMVFREASSTLIDNNNQPVTKW